LPQGKTGTGMVTSIAFSIPIDSVDYWRKRLNENGVETKEGKRFGDSFIQFEDPHGLSPELVETPIVHSVLSQSSDSKSAAHQLVGFDSATALLRSLKETQSLLGNSMGMVLHDQKATRYRFKMKLDDAIGRFYDVVIDSQAEPGQQGGGTVHHIAFRTPTDDEPKYW
jgi:glyoxalase family protein